MSLWDPYCILEFNFYCDPYGLDTISTGTAFAFYMEMYKYGILTKKTKPGITASVQSSGTNNFLSIIWQFGLIK